MSGGAGGRKAHQEKPIDRGGTKAEYAVFSFAAQAAAEKLAASENSADIFADYDEQNSSEQVVGLLTARYKGG